MIWATLLTTRTFTIKAADGESANVLYREDKVRLRWTTALHLHQPLSPTQS